MDDDGMLEHIYTLGEQLTAEIIDRTKGKGHLIIGSLAVILANFESQHEGTIKDVLEGSRLMLAISRAEGAVPGNDTLN